MEGFINWGSESPEQRRIRQRWEEDLLFEQARMKAMALQTAGAVGSGGGRAACDPEAGVTIYITGGEETIVAAQGIYQGLDKNGNPVYRTDVISGIFVGTIDYDTETSQWRLTIIQGEKESYSYSPSLISQNWTDTIGFLTPLYSVCGTLDLDEWCIDIPDFGFGPLKAQALPGWLGIPVTEQPNLWLYAVGIYGWFRDGDQFGWFVELDEVGEAEVLGGSQDVLPLSVDIVAEIKLTANAGACEY